MNAVNDYYMVLPTLNDEYETDAPPRSLKIRGSSGGWDDWPLKNNGIMHAANLTAPAWADFLVNDIVIRKAFDRRATYDFGGVYATTIHELGHAAHWNLVGFTTLQSGNNMRNTDTVVRETWAEAVMQFAYRRKFNPQVSLSQGASSNAVPFVRGPWVVGNQQCDRTLTDLQGTHYVFILGPDLWDSYSQSCGGVVDGVNGIPLRDIFSTLKDARHWYQWRDALAQKHSNQASQINTYFNQFGK